MLKTFTLPNGIQTATYNIPSLKSIHVRISVKGGSLVEDRRYNGVAHFMEHMLVQGIPSYPNVEEFSYFIEGLAGSYGAYTKNTVVSFYLTVPAGYIEDALKITAETFFKPLFVKEALEKERQAVIEEIMQKMDSHWYKISKFFQNTRFPSHHPLTYDGGGSLETVKNITREKLITYWEDFFLPKNTYLLISGNFNDKKLTGLLEKYFVGYQDSKNFSGFPKMSPEDLSDRQVAIRSDENLKTCYIDLTYPSLSQEASLVDRVTQNLALVIFGQLRNSRLFKLLRYQKGLVYDVGAGAAQYPGLGYCYISSQVSPVNLAEVVDLIAKELELFVTNGPTDDELSFAKNYLTNQWLMAFDHPSSISTWVEDHLIWDKRVLLPEDYAAMIKDMTPSDLSRIMREHWDFTKLNLVIQGPIEDTEKNKDTFAQLLSHL